MDENNEEISEDYNACGYMIVVAYNCVVYCDKEITSEPMDPDDVLEVRHKDGSKLHSARIVHDAVEGTICQG